MQSKKITTTEYNKKKEIEKIQYNQKTKRRTNNRFLWSSQNNSHITRLMENVNNVFWFYERQLFCRIRKCEIRDSNDRERILCVLYTHIHISICVSFQQQHACWCSYSCHLLQHVDYSSRTMKWLSFFLVLCCVKISLWIYSIVFVSRSLTLSMACMPFILNPDFVHILSVQLSNEKKTMKKKNREKKTFFYEKVWDHWIPIELHRKICRMWFGCRICYTQTSPIHDQMLKITS